MLLDVRVNGRLLGFSQSVSGQITLDEPQQLISCTLQWRPSKGSAYFYLQQFLLHLSNDIELAIVVALPLVGCDLLI